MGRYDDIIELPHHQSTKHVHMPIGDRAAQFSPFAALTGHEAAISETARLTDARMELEEDRKSMLDAELRMLNERIHERPKVIITYFRPDARKAGGAYVNKCGVVKRMDEYRGELCFEDGERIVIADIFDVRWESVR